MNQITCTKCGRVLGKFNTDGTIHIKHSASGFEFIGSFSRIMFICPTNYYNRNGKTECGQKTVFENSRAAGTNPSENTDSIAREKVLMAC